MKSKQSNSKRSADKVIKDINNVLWKEAWMQHGTGLHGTVQLDAVPQITGRDGGGPQD